MELKKLNQIEAYDLATTKIKELYQTDGGKKFIHHLIYAFTSGENNYVLASKRKVVDCLSKSLLDTIYSEENNIKDEFILKKIDEVKNTLDPKDQLKIMVEINDRVVELVGDKVLSRIAYSSPLTNKIIGQEELQALVDFVKAEIEGGNEVIAKMMLYSKYKNKPKNKKYHKVKDSNKSKLKPKSKDKPKIKDESDNELQVKLQQLKNKYK